MLGGRDKALAKKLLTYHRVPAPDFALLPTADRAPAAERLAFPLIVKSLTFDASIGISQASVVETDERLAERVRFIHETSARTRSSRVTKVASSTSASSATSGSKRLPTWELSFEKMPEAARKIATERLKWSLTYQKKHGIVSGPAKGELPDALRQPDRQRSVQAGLFVSSAFRVTPGSTSGWTPSGEVYVIEANPNPQIARGAKTSPNRPSGPRCSYAELLERIMALGLQWQPERTAWD